MFIKKFMDIYIIPVSNLYFLLYSLFIKSIFDVSLPPNFWDLLSIKKTHLFPDVFL